MNTEQRINTNRLITVALGSMLWTVVLNNVIASFDFMYALILAVWIGLGSHHYVLAVVDFRRKLSLKIQFALALLAPGWPILYWNWHIKTRAASREAEVD